MGRLTKAEIGFKGLFSSLDKVIKDWHPPLLKNELEYRNALADHLRSALPEDSRVEREFRHQGTTCDIYVLHKGILSSDEVFFEVKRNLRKKPDYDRLVGQIEGLTPRNNKIFVVLVGNTNPELFGRLKDQFRGYLEGFKLAETFRVVLVPDERTLGPKVINLSVAALPNISSSGR
jgi:hypothetical protein